ncbi:MAG: hypothetical protein QXM53_09395 [Thermofilaceae archaeon]
MSCSNTQVFIERLEYQYFTRLDSLIHSNIQEIVSLFARRFKLYNYWKNLLDAGSKRLTDLGIGAERVFWKIITESFPTWRPVPLFIGSNLFFETDDAFVHIDIKSVYVDNLRDYQGLVEVGDAQTSYPMKKKYEAQQSFMPKIQPSYTIDNQVKYSLTYFIQIIYEKPEKIISENLDPGPVALVLISLPNGELYGVYGEDIVKHPKSYITKNKQKIRPANYRYYYSKKPCYICLQSIPGLTCTYRVRVYFNKKYLGHTVYVSSDSSQKSMRITPEVIASLNSKMCVGQNCYIKYFEMT